MIALTEEFPPLAGITGILTAAGLDSAGVHDWFQQGRSELAGLTPARALVPLMGPEPAQRVRALAQADANELRLLLPKHGGVEGSD